VYLNDTDLDEIDKLMASGTRVAGPCPENVYSAAGRLAINPQRSRGLAVGAYGNRGLSCRR
jgi:hypothetical protein